MKIATFVLSTLALALSHDLSIIAAATAPDAVSLVEENTEERATAQNQVKVINFDENVVDYYADYPRNDETGIYFDNTEVYAGDYSNSYYEEFAVMSAHSKPNFGYPSTYPYKITMECYRGRMQVRSVRLTPLPVKWSPDTFKITITGKRNENDDAPVVETIKNLKVNKMKKAKRVRLGKKFKKVSVVTFHVDGYKELFGLDDIQVKIRAKKPCKEKP
mmetsp:Transcript_7989/g.11887  ORF Transcript_7989/g.11887 Transcript_7989/m.11887 type:complete len:218 (-) Transcript_7989:95-748(-)|eukprot:CAMPEP_0194107128 /NCGR_PEP_ID=MMETSP0150-20130528/7035_1 /TAXON_ID=122233 /ORGANISM="Chaetoceros debilis, Strain MM31A-1" /LENGTH=217 /DNA_ID=CAMNT_0038795429 /DNA_START=72 /DNA_END=725 /DNA_ORIENTATION=+